MAFFSNIIKNAAAGQRDAAKDNDELDNDGHDIFGTMDTKIFSTATNEDCHWVVWGKWNDDSKDPLMVKFNIAKDKEENKSQILDKEEPNKVVDIIFGKQFKIVLYNNGELYSWGISAKGCLGLGRKRWQTFNKLEKIDFGADEFIVEIKAGNSHILARAISGKVYAWGDNIFGQWGIQPKKPKDSRVTKQKQYKNIFKPKVIYNPEKKGNKAAIQILCYKDTSFILNDGEADDNDVLGFGKNENDLLWNASSSQIVTTPVKIKTGTGDIKRIDVQHGHFIAYTDVINEDDIIEQGSNSQFDDEDDDIAGELKDNVHEMQNFGIKGAKNNPKGAQISISKLLGTGSKDRRNSDTQSMVSGYSRTSKRSTKNKDASVLGQYSEMIWDVQSSMRKIDGHLRSVLKNMVTPVSKANELDNKINEDDLPEREESDNEMINTHDLIVDEYLISLNKRKDKAKFKNMLESGLRGQHIDISKYESDIKDSLIKITYKKASCMNYKNETAKKAKDQIYTAKESVMLRSLNIVGLKMKLYLEKLKAINSVEILRKIKNAKFEDFQGKDEFKKWIKLNKEIKRAIEEDSDKYRQYHYKLDSVTSAVLSYITSVMYHNADLWEATNVLTMSNYLLMKKLNQYDRTNKTMSNLYEIHKELKDTDYDILYKKHIDLIADKPNSLEKFKVLEKITLEILDKLEEDVTENFKVDKSKDEMQTIDKMNTMILDNIMIRKLLIKTQEKFITHMPV